MFSTLSPNSLKTIYNVTSNKTTPIIQLLSNKINNNTNPYFKLNDNPKVTYPDWIRHFIYI
jgi:hypothetical protein